MTVYLPNLMCYKGGSEQGSIPSLGEIAMNKMHRVIPLFLAAALAALVAACATGKAAETQSQPMVIATPGQKTLKIQTDIKPIKDVYKDHFLIGTAVSAKNMQGARLELLKMHFNAATAENAMKPSALQPMKGNFSFAGADIIVDKILELGMKMHGHTLVWHQSSPAWMNTDDTGKSLKREEALANLRSHIQTVVEHFGNRVISWDVVNEAISDDPADPGDWKASLRPTPWLAAIGDDYVEQAFLAAREVLDAHPEWDVKLYYNDYSMDNQGKALAVYNMIKTINENYGKTHPGKLLIDGMGMQGHYSLSTDPENVRTSMERFISLGLEISISELDVRASRGDGKLDEDYLDAQALQYARLFSVFKAKAAHIRRVTFWGLDDSQSWLNAQRPLLFDERLTAKPAYYGVIEPERIIAESKK